MTLTIRPLTSSDRTAWEPLWAGYLTFYETAAAPALIDTTWARLLDPAEPMYVLGCLDGPELIGIVHFIFHRSTWTAGNYCYLQDLFTSEAARGRGAGRALIEAVYGRARDAGANRVYWMTQESNATARALYDKLADHPGFTIYRKVM